MKDSTTLKFLMAAPELKVEGRNLDTKDLRYLQMLRLL